jgi:hypothetical protein
MPMRIALPSATGTAGARPAPHPAGAAPAFTLGSLPETPAPRSLAGTGPVAALASLATLLAAQESDGPTGRRRRAMKRGRQLVEQLGQVQLALLAGNLSPATIGQLRRHLAEEIDLKQDPALGRLMRDLDLRAAVEIAKIDYAVTEQTPAR